MDWESIKQKFIDLGKDGGIAALKLLAVFILGFIIVKILLKIIKVILSKSKLSVLPQTFIYSVTRFILYLIFIIILLQTVGIPTTSIVALFATASLAIGLALQGCLANLANGFMLISARHFKEGDYVNIDGTEGKIVALKMTTTRICTLDNKVIILPNSKVATANIINYNGNDTRRVDFTFGVAYESDTHLVKKIITDVMLSDGRVKTDPAPFIGLKNLGESSIDFFCFCWVDTEDYWDVFYYVQETVFNEFKKQKISIPYGQLEVRLRNDNVKLPFNKNKLQERVEKVSSRKESHLLEKIIGAPKIKLKELQKNNKTNIVEEINTTGKDKKQKKNDKTNKELKDEKRGKINTQKNIKTSDKKSEQKNIKTNESKQLVSQKKVKQLNNNKKVNKIKK